MTKEIQEAVEKDESLSEQYESERFAEKADWEILNQYQSLENLGLES